MLVVVKMMVSIIMIVVGNVGGYVKDLILRCGFWFFYGLVCGESMGIGGEWP